MVGVVIGQLGRTRHTARGPDCRRVSSHSTVAGRPQPWLQGRHVVPSSNSATVVRLIMPTVVPVSNPPITHS